MKITLDSFRQVIKQSGLVDDDVFERETAEFERLLAEKAANPVDGQPVPKADAKTFALFLIEKKVLSLWQAENLLKGKHKGFRLGKYRLISLLGKGGMSSVYLAEHTLMKRRVAIKVLPHKKVHDASYLGRFHREAQAVAALDHPNIVRAYDVDSEIDGKMEIHFLVMEYVEGKSLQEVIAKRGVLPPHDAADYIRQAAEGLEHAHEAGLVHRDIKPGNLLLDKTGTVKLLDLGLARFFDDEENSLTVEHDEKVLGTADYLAPEQAVDSHSVDKRADLYSLGCTLYFLLTGNPPFNEGTLAQRLIAHQTKEPPPVSKARDDVPESFNRLLLRLMAKKPDDRPQSAQQAADEFANWLAKDAGEATSSAEIESVIEEPDTEDPLGSFLNQLDGTPQLRSSIELTSSSGVGPMADSNVGNSQPAAGQSAAGSNIHGRGPSSIVSRKSSKANPVVLYGGIGAAVVVLGLIAWLMSGPGDSPAPDSPGGIAKGPSNEGPDGDIQTPPSRPAVKGNTITVGADGNFGTLAEAVSYVRENFTPFSDSDTRTIELAAGETFTEPLSIDSSGLEPFPRFVTISTDAANPATLVGDGSKPVVSITAAERLTVRNVVIDASSSETAVELKGYLAGSRMENVLVRNFRRIGVNASGVAGLGGAKVHLVNVTVRATDDRTPTTAVKLLSGIPETGDIEIVRCRLQGPFATGIEIVGPTKNVAIRRTVFDRLTNGISFPGIAADFDRVQVIGNTFHNVEASLYFAAQPAGRSSKLAVAQNLFTEVERELVVDSGLDRGIFGKLLTNGGWKGENFSTRPKTPPANNEFRIVDDAGYEVQDPKYVSTDWSKPGYLKPQVQRFKTAKGGPDPKYIGAIQP